MEEELPKAIWEGELELMGRTIRVYQLDDGRRIFNAEDVQEVLAALDFGAFGKPA